MTLESSVDPDQIQQNAAFYTEFRIIVDHPFKFKSTSLTSKIKLEESTRHEWAYLVQSTK